MNMQPLHCAAFEGHAKIVEMLLKHHPQLETRNGYGGTPLTAAIHGAAHRVNASGDYAGVIRALIAAGVSVDGPEKDGRPLRFAAKAGYLDGVKLLAEAGARVDLCDEEGRNARGIAEEMGYQDIAEFLRSSPGRR
jgi:ankyrin repeat protein